MFAPKKNTRFQYTITLAHFQKLEYHILGEKQMFLMPSKEREARGQSAVPSCKEPRIQLVIEPVPYLRCENTFETWIYSYDPYGRSTGTPKWKSGLSTPNLSSHGLTSISNVQIHILNIYKWSFMGFWSFVAENETIFQSRYHFGQDQPMKQAHLTVLIIMEGHK